jgi:hypothetical protein
MKKVINCTTNEELEVELSVEEIAQQEIDEANHIEMAQEKAEAEAAKDKVLAKLGLTADEAKLLLS